METLLVFFSIGGIIFYREDKQVDDAQSKFPAGLHRTSPKTGCPALFCDDNNSRYIVGG